MKKLDLVRMINPALLLTDGEKSTDSPILAESSSVSIDQYAVDDMNLRLTTTQKSRIGRVVARRFRQANPGVEIETVPKFVNGEMRMVKIYPRMFIEVIRECINTEIG